MVRCWVLRYEEAIKSILDCRKITWFGCDGLFQQTFSSASSLQTSSDTCCQMDPLGYIVELEDASQKKVKSSLDEHDARDLCRDAFNWILRYYDNSKHNACCFHCRWQCAVFKTYQSAYNIWNTQGRVSEYLEEDQKCQEMWECWWCCEMPRIIPQIQCGRPKEFWEAGRDLQSEKGLAMWLWTNVTPQHMLHDTTSCCLCVLKNHTKYNLSEHVSVWELSRLPGQCTRTWRFDNDKWTGHVNPYTSNRLWKEQQF